MNNFKDTLNTPKNKGPTFNNFSNNNQADKKDKKPSNLKNANTNRNSNANSNNYNTNNPNRNSITVTSGNKK